MGQHLGEQPVRRIVQKCTFKHFSLGGHKLLFPMPKGVTFKSICPDNQYPSVYNNDWGIARYSLYKITAAQATTAPVPRPKGEPWQPNQTPGKLISVTVIIHFCNTDGRLTNWLRWQTEFFFAAEKELFTPAAPRNPTDLLQLDNAIVLRCKVVCNSLSP